MVQKPLKSASACCLRALAGLLLTVLLPVSWGGCLLPQDAQVLPTVPPRRNTPLRIVASKPQVETTISLPVSACPAPEFEVIVQDEDVSDDLEPRYKDVIRSQWFVDRTETSPVYPGDVSAESATEGRVLKAPRKLQTAFEALDYSRPHRLEVWVTDGDFKPDNPAEATRPKRVLADGTLVEDLAYTDSHVWLIRVQPCFR
jgi:hypothetical protein